MYKAEKKDKRITIYYNDEFFIELDNDNEIDPKSFISSHKEFLDDIRTGEYDEELLDKVLTTYNAYYNGKSYKKNKTGQLTIFDVEPEEEYVRVEPNGDKYIYKHTKYEFEQLAKQYATFWFNTVQNEDGTYSHYECKCRVNGKTIYEE